MSPALNPTFYQVIIRIFQGQNLPAMDSGIGMFSKDKIDAYFKTEFKKKKYKTKTLIQYKGSGYEHINWD